MRRTLLALLATVAVSLAGDHDVLRIGPVLVADSKEDCQKLQEIAEDHDTRAGMEMIRNGTALYLPEGTVVIVEDIGWEYDRIRLKGSSKTLWISNHALAQFYNQ